MQEQFGSPPDNIIEDALNQSSGHGGKARHMLQDYWSAIQDDPWRHWPAQDTVQSCSVQPTCVKHAVNLNPKQKAKQRRLLVAMIRCLQGLAAAFTEWHKNYIDIETGPCMMMMMRHLNLRNDFEGVGAKLQWGLDGQLDCVRVPISLAMTMDDNARAKHRALRGFKDNFQQRRQMAVARMLRGANGREGHAHSSALVWGEQGKIKLAP